MKTIVLRCARISSRIAGWIAGQMLALRLRVRGRAAGLLVERQDLAGRGHVLDRDDDLELERLAGAGVDDRHLAARPDAAEEPGDRLERSLGRRQADPLRRRRLARRPRPTRRAAPGAPG